MPEKYKSKEVSDKEIDLILKNWGDDKVFFCENHHGSCYWNKKTGEILWQSNEGGGSNASLLS